jgi:hypothetical protein
MIAAWNAGWSTGRYKMMVAKVTERDRLFPPVSRPGMPELAGEWALMTPGNVLAVTDCLRGEAEAHQPKIPSSVIVRLAVVEVVEEEPEAAPSGWRYEVRNDGVAVAIAQPGGKGIAAFLTADEAPPIDREYVAALLERVSASERGR